MLIVNADDWGGEPWITDAIERCFDAGAISSTTAMVFMADSGRAAQIAGAGARPVGLHLNLVQPFLGDVPPAVRARHERICAAFSSLGRRRLRRWAYSPGMRADLARAIEDQLDEFRRIYGHEPTHLDSHLHAHLGPDVLLSPALLRGLRVRQTVIALPRARFGPGAIARAAKHLAISGRFTTTSRFWSLGSLHPALGGSGLEAALDRARRRNVEIMVHPSFPEELPILLGDEWRSNLRGVPLGDFRDVAPVGGRSALQGAGVVALAASISPAP